MIRYLIRRALWAVFTFVLASLVVYVVFFMIETDPFSLKRSAVGQPVLQHVIAELHLNVPIYQQYWIFVWNIVRHQSLGYSFQNGGSVRWLIAQDFGVTGSLVFGSLVFWILISVPIGVLSALRPRSLFDRLAMVFVLIGIAAPPLWIGLILSYVFGFRLGWFPIADYCSFFSSPQGGCSGPAEWAYHMILPWTAFTWMFAAMYVRMIRASLLEVVGEDYIRSARAKGAHARRVVLRHMLRNSLLPVVTMLGMDMAVAFGGAVFIERVFDLNGLGADLIQSIGTADIPVTAGVILFLTMVAILMNFLVDVAYVWMDPRIRLP